jgi:hypothetical protein
MVVGVNVAPVRPARTPDADERRSKPELTADGLAPPSAGPQRRGARVTPTSSTERLRGVGATSASWRLTGGHSPTRPSGRGGLRQHGAAETGHCYRMVHGEATTTPKTARSRRRAPEETPATSPSGKRHRGGRVSTGTGTGAGPRPLLSRCSTLVGLVPGRQVPRFLGAPVKTVRPASQRRSRLSPAVASCLFFPRG